MQLTGTGHRSPQGCADGAIFLPQMALVETCRVLRARDRVRLSSAVAFNKEDVAADTQGGASVIDPHSVHADMRALVVETRPAVIGDGQIRLRLTGELNNFTTQLLADGVSGAVRDTPCALIELDIAGVRFIDSAGIRGLLHRRAEAERAGCRLVLVNPTDWVRQVLRVTGLLET